MDFDFNRDYTKKQAQAILGLSVNEFNKWLGFLDFVKPKEIKKPGGRGRPAHMLEINGLYIMGVFKSLKGAGFDRKTVAEMIEKIDQQRLVELIKYAESQDIIQKLTTISGLYDLLSELLGRRPEEVKHIETKLFNKISEFDPKGGIYLCFQSEHDLSGCKFAQCCPVVDPVDLKKVPSKFISFLNIINGFKVSELAHILNLGKVVSDIQYQIETFFDVDGFWMRTYEKIGWDIVEEMNK